MKKWTRSFGLMFAMLISISIVFTGCDDGEKVATTPGGQADCYAYGTCTQSFGQNAFGYQNGYPNFNAYNGQVPYQQSGFQGCGSYQYPVYYPNYGYACAHQQAFNQGYNYSAFNYQPSSYEFQSAHNVQFPNYYNYNYSYAFQGCVVGSSNSNSCACQQLNGVPSQFGVCGNY